MNLLKGLICAVLTLNWASGGVIQDHDRIIFVGDSITGQGAKAGKNGWVALIGEGLAQERPAAHPTLIPLGGSGSTVNAWLIHEQRSRTQPVFLDVKDIEVGKALDAGAEVVVIMLGMNDVLAPSLHDRPADFDLWADKYRSLIKAIRARSHPRVVGLATITPCTENPNSPKSKVLTQLNTELAAVARTEGAIVLPTHHAALEILAAGRSYRPDFHVTGDFVHPNVAGHLAIAVGMLRGLGEDQAAAALLKAHSSLFLPPADKLPTLSYTLERLQDSPDDATHRFVVEYRLSGIASSNKAPVVTVTLPEKWKANPKSMTGATGRFELTGVLDRIENHIALDADYGDIHRQQDIVIPAGWRIAVGAGTGRGWKDNTIYDPAQDKTSLDETLAKGDGLNRPVSFPAGDAQPWQLYVASNDFTGLSRPGSVDLAALTFYQFHDLSYGGRWIYSEHERPVSLLLTIQAFAPNYGLCVWLNGKAVYAGKLASEQGRKATAPAQLQQGWNLLVFKSSYVAWQWQFSIDVTGTEKDDLADLRYATTASSGKP